MEYENYHRNDAALPLPVKELIPDPPEYTNVNPLRGPTSNDKDRNSKASPNQYNSTNGAWLLRRTSIQVSSEPAEPFDNDKESVSELSTATTKRSSEKDGGLRKKLFKQGQGHTKNAESISDVRSVSSWQRTEAFDTGFGTKVFIEAGRPRKEEQERQYDMKGLEQAASVKRWGGGGKPGEAWGKLQKVCQCTHETSIYWALTTTGP